MKTIKDFMKKLKDGEFKIEYKYSNGYVKVFNIGDVMYALGKNTNKDIYNILFSFTDESDLGDKCEDILDYEIRFCDYCGCPMNKGYTDDSADFYNCEKCFPKDMNRRYGKGNWREYKNEDDEPNRAGGFYEYFDNDEWLPEPSYFTEWY